MSIVITCAASRLVAAAAERLANRAGGPRLILADAEPERLGPAMRTLGETRQADFTDPLTLASAFIGAETLLLPGGACGALSIAQASAAVDAARAAGIERIVLLSSTDPRPGNPAAWAGRDRAAEAVVRASGLGWTILRVQESLEDFLGIGRAQRAGGRMISNRAGGASAPVGLDDAGAAVAAALADESLRGRTLDLTGPALATTAELAAALGMVDIAHKDAKYLEQLIRDGRSMDDARSEVALGRAIREGYYAVVSQDVQALTGRAAKGVTAALG